MLVAWLDPEGLLVLCENSSQTTVPKIRAHWAVLHFKQAAFFNQQTLFCLRVLILVLEDRISFHLGWLLTYYVVEDGLEL